MPTSLLPWTQERHAGLAIRRVSVIPQRQRVEIADLQQAFPNGHIVACDFLVEGMLQGEEVPGGYELEGVLNVDHHAPVRRMERHLSSVHLAMAQVQSYGPAEAEAAVVINHVNADSVLSSLIMAGLLQPHPFWGEAGLRYRQCAHLACPCPWPG